MIHLHVDGCTVKNKNCFVVYSHMHQGMIWLRKFSFILIERTLNLLLIGVLFFLSSCLKKEARVGSIYEIAATVEMSTVFIHAQLVKANVLTLSASPCMTGASFLRGTQSKPCMLKDITRIHHLSE